MVFEQSLWGSVTNVCKMMCEKFGCKRNWSWLGFGLAKFGGLAFCALGAKLVKKWSHSFWAILVGNCHKCMQNVVWKVCVPSCWPGYVFMRNLARQLRTPSLWQPVNTCKEGQMGALAVVCTPTLNSASKKHQNSPPPYRNTVDGALKVVKRTVYCVYFSLW